MSTKPKARKFRIKRDGTAAALAPDPNTTAEPQDQEVESLFTPPTDDGFGAQTFPSRERKAQPSEKAPADELEAIKREGLTGRQLRMARRVAQRQGLTPSSDFDAVRQLRAKG
ncbi:MAG: capsule biosynthesis protein, partial [Litoreibacter sp.]|nr:capsule biosynthesis protein [Litoreibacter sp.]